MGFAFLDPQIRVYQSVMYNENTSSMKLEMINDSEGTFLRNISTDSNSAYPESFNFNQTNHDSDSVLTGVNFEMKSNNKLSDELSLPHWTNYSQTQFTNHVFEVLKYLNASEYKECGVHVRLFVQEPYSIPQY
jgi:hypothetical protein